MIPGPSTAENVAVYTYRLLALVRLLLITSRLITKVIDGTGKLISLDDDDCRQHKETSRSARPKQPLVQRTKQGDKPWLWLLAIVPLVRHVAIQG